MASHRFDTRSVAPFNVTGRIAYDPKAPTPIIPFAAFPLCGDEGGPLIVGIDSALPRDDQQRWVNEAEQHSTAA